MLKIEDKYSKLIIIINNILTTATFNLYFINYSINWYTTVRRIYLVLHIHYTIRHCNHLFTCLHVKMLPRRIFARVFFFVLQVIQFSQ